MTGKVQISDEEIQTFVDGALDAKRSSEIESDINADPDLAERVAAFRSDKETLRRVYGPLINRPLPKEWLDLTRRSARERRRPIEFHYAIAAIAATILVVVAGLVFYRAVQSPMSGGIVEAALDARGDGVVAERTIAIDPGTNANQYNAILSMIVSSEIKVPNLVPLGYRLTSIRLYSGLPDGEAAELLYRDDGNRLFSLYLKRSDGTTRFDQFAQDGLRVCIWQDEVIAMVMAGDVSTAAMQRLASLAYTGLVL